MFLWLTHTQAREIAEHARRVMPDEACGLILGRGDRVHHLVSLDNSAKTPHTRFEMDPAQFVRAMLQAEAEGLNLLGIYHSHPRGEPIPSETDIREAYYPDAAYVIAGLQHGDARLAAWQIADGTVQRIDLYIGDRPPANLPEHGLSRAQITAIIITAVLAFMLMLVISLSLLPPAPPLPTPTG